MIYILFGLPKRYTTSLRPTKIQQNDTESTLREALTITSTEVMEGEAIRLNIPEVIAIYLACHDKAIKREEVADLFFEKATVTKTLHNLRSNINKFRKATEHLGLSELLVAESKTIDFQVRCDVVDFEKAFAEKRYQEVLDCYQGEFLEGFTGLRTAPAFNTWVEQKRTEFKDKYFVSSRELAHSLATDHKVSEALDILNTCIQKNILDEKTPELCEQLLTIALHYNHKQEHGQELKALNFYKDYKSKLKLELEQLDLFDSATDELEIPEELEQLAHELKEQLRKSRQTHTTIIGVSGDVTSPATSTTPKNVLEKSSYIPPQPTTFIGRDNEISELSSQILNADTRMISLIGYGGIGKTRLAVQLATSLQEHYIDGVFVIELVALQSVNNIPSTINTVLGIKTEVGETPENALGRVLQDKRLLLVLDNFEHLLEGRDLVDSLLGNNSNVDIIVTSREALNLSWEYRYDIEGLTYPRIKNPDLVYPKDLTEGEAVPENILENEALPETAKDITDFESYDAIKLFERSAKTRVKDFSVTDNKVAIQQICSFVEGLPLGIELAASWVASHSCEVIAETLQKDVTGIKTRLKDVPDRHKSLDVVFEHSWGLLEERQQEILAKTAIFHGGFDALAAEAVIGTTFADLAELCEKSLVRIDDNGRYSLHEVIRQNSVGKLVASPKIHSITTAAHQKYYMDFVESCDYFELSDNLENIEAAWFSAIKSYSPNTNSIDVSSVFRKTYLSQGIPNRALSILIISLELLKENEYVEESNILKANLMRGIAYFLDELGFHKEALDYNQQVLNLAKKLDDPKLLTNAFHKLAYSYENTGKLIEANHILEKSLKNASNSHTAMLLAEQARVQSKMGNFDDAEINYKQSIAITEEIGDIQDIIHRKNNYSKLLLDIGQYEEAKALISETLLFAEKNNVLSFQHYLHKKQAQIYLEEGNYSDAWTIAQQAFNECNEQGTKSALPAIIALLGDISLATSKIPTAKKYYADVLALTQEIRNSDGKYTALIGLAKIHVLNKENSEAVTLLSSLLLKPNLRSSLKTSVNNELKKLKNALGEVNYFKAFQEGTIEFLEQYCLQV